MEPLLKSVKSGGAVLAVRNEIDRLIQFWPVADVVHIVRICQAKCCSNPRHEFVLLIPFGFWLCNYKSSIVVDILERLRILIADKQNVPLAASLFALEATFLSSAGRYEQAIAALDKGFATLERQGMVLSVELVATSVIVANRLGRHDLALRNAYKCYEVAFNNERSGELEIANFGIINSNRLMQRGLGRPDTSFGFDKLLQLIEEGRSNIALYNQRVLPVYAAFAELGAEVPDTKRVSWLLGLAEELKILDSPELSRRAYFLATAKLHSLQGETTWALDAFYHSRHHRGVYDCSQELEDRELCAALNAQPVNKSEAPPLRGSVWLEMESRLDRWKH